jgi:hypothetical protein
VTTEGTPPADPEPAPPAGADPPAPPAPAPEEYEDVWDPLPSFPLMMLVFAITTLIAYLMFRLYGGRDDDPRGPRAAPPPPRPDAPASDLPRHEREVAAAMRRRRQAVT